jgi:hypothetical protein
MTKISVIDFYLSDKSPSHYAAPEGWNSPLRGQTFLLRPVYMKLVSITRSDLPGKKLKAVFKDEKTGRTKTTHFGASGMDDYTKTKDVEQRARYRKRHAKDLQTGDATRAGFLSYYILWGDSTSIAANISSYKRRFGL